jgi:hypothetical protein
MQRWFWLAVLLSPLIVAAAVFFVLYFGQGIFR